MFRTKRDVDRHVRNVLGRIKEEKERNSRGFQFAKLYYDVKDYESAKKYLQAFFSVREALPQPHKLMGQICEGLKDKVAAVEAYKRSLDLDPDQKDLLLKVCELYSDGSVYVNPESAKHWVEQAELYFPNDFTIFKLKEKIAEAQGDGNTEEVEMLISTELLKNPGNVKLHIKLIRLLLQSDSVDRAYEQALKTDKTMAFTDSEEWFDCIFDAYQKYQNLHDCKGNTEFFTHKLYAMVALMYLRLRVDDRHLASCVTVLQQLDEDLNNVLDMCRVQNLEWQALLLEIQGQYFFLLGTFLLKRARQTQLSWKDASSLSFVCYCISSTLPTLDPKAPWFSQAPKDKKKFLDRMFFLGNYRLSQGGNMVRQLGKQEGQQRQKLCTPQRQEHLYGLVFTSPDIRKSPQHSFLLSRGLFTKANLDLPSKAQVRLYDAVSYRFYSDKLEELVWLALQHYSCNEEAQPDYLQLFGYQLFKDMKYNVTDLNSGDPSSLSQLDVQIYLWTCVRWASIEQRDRKRNLHKIADKPSLLPAIISPPLCSLPQLQWWEAVCKIGSQSASDNLSKAWGILVRGLETVRLISPNTLPLGIIIHLAQTLEERVKEIESLDPGGLVPPKLAALRARTAFYWRAAMDILKRLERNQTIWLPKESLFPGEMPSDMGQIQKFKERTQLALGVVEMREGNFEEALQYFSNVNLPQSSIYTGQIYKTMAEKKTHGDASPKSARMLEQIALLSRAKGAFYRALDTLDDTEEVAKQKVKNDLDDVISKLISLESGGDLSESMAARHHDSPKESDDSDLEDEPSRESFYSTPNTQMPAKQLFGTKYPSPTRLEYQLKSMDQTNQMVVSRMDRLEETVRNNQKQMEFLQDLLKGIKEENSFLRQQLQMALAGGLGLPMGRPSMSGLPGTPQQLQAMNQSFPIQPYDFPAAGGSIPTHISQYGYGIGSPARPSSIFGGQEDQDEEAYQANGEYYEEEQYVGMPDPGLIQDWPFGHKAGVEGQSTITYAPKNKPNPQMNAAASPGMFANSLRGPSVQYSSMQQQPRGPPPAVIGPGYFSQSPQPPQQPPQQPQQQQVQGAFSLPQAGMLPQQPQAPSATGQVPFNPQMSQLANQPGQQYLSALSKSPALSPALPAQGNTLGTPNSVNSQPASSMMPPNAVASSSLFSKPRLIPGSVGVAPPATVSKPQTQAAPVFSQTTAQSSPAGKQQVSAFGGSSPSVSKPPAFQGMPSPSQASGASAASTLQAMANKHQSGIQQVEEKGKFTPQAPPASTQSTPQKFGGFSFTSTPIIKDTAKEERPKVVPSVPVTTSSAVKPFSGFSFSTIASPVTGTQSASSFVKPGTTSSTMTLGQSSSASTMSFGGLAATGNPDALKAGGDSKGFSAAGSMAFKTPGSPRKPNRSMSEDEHVEEYEPNVDFQPVVPLPGLVEVKTGEEDEQKMFGDRAKLYRFDTESNQWKERGIGEMKLLKHKQTGRVRVLMRREQVLKLCANHYISKEMKLTQMSSSDKAWVWSAMDYSEEEMRVDQFAIKLKTAEVASKFKEIFDKCQTDMFSEDSKPAGPAAVTDTPKGATKTAVKQPVKNDLSKLFTKAAGSWNCEVCLINNESKSLRCPCCQSFKPGVKPEDTKENPAAAKPGSSTAGSGFKIGGNTGGSGTGFTFGSQSVTSSTDAKPAGGFSFGGAKPETEPAKPVGGFVFGGTSVTTKAEAEPSKPAGGFVFGGSTPAKTETESAKQTGGFVFGGSASKPGSTSDAKSAGFAVDTKARTFSLTTLGIATLGKNAAPSVSAPTSVSKPDVTDTTKPLAGMFTAAAGSWKCDVCMVENVPNVDNCACCTTPKPQSKADQASSSNAAKSLSQLADPAPVSSSSTSGSGFRFGGNKADTAAPGQSGFAFGSSTQETGKPTSKPTFPVKTEGEKGFVFGGAAKPAEDAFKFSLTPSDSKATPAAPFTFSLSPKADDSKKPIKVTTPKTPEISEDGFYMNKEGDDSHIYFEPVIELPELVQINTGEETEECLFEHRAKLYRFFKGEWKERGLGDIKVLYSKEKNKARVLMRREQILKICCNHYILPEMKLKPMPSSQGKALIWFAMDFADGVEQHEQFSVRFKTAEIADDFLNAFEKAKLCCEGSRDSSPAASPQRMTAPSSTRGGPKSQVEDNDDDVEIVKVETATPEEIQLARTYQLPDNFYVYTRQPDCPGCRGCKETDDEDGDDEEEEGEYTDVEEEEVQEEEEEEEEEENVRQIDLLGSGDRATEQGETTGSLYLARLLSEESAGSDLIQQVIKPKEKEDSTNSGTSMPFSLGGGDDASFSFSSLAATANPVGFSKDTSKPFHWHGAGQKLFRANQSTGGDSGDEDTVEENQDIHFEPVVPLPELVEVKTGEEDESPIFSNRAKVYRFDATTNQWKEKGVGEFKILQHKESGHHRLLLRREQVFKLACNHRLTPDLVMRPMDTSEVAWCWTAQDFSDGEAKMEQLAVKFKTIEQAKEFKTAFDEAIQFEIEAQAIDEASDEGTAVETIGPASTLERLLEG